MRNYIYTSHSVTVDDVCAAFKINVDVRFVDSKTYRKFIIYHMVPFSERRIYERLGIELYETLAMPAFMLCGVVPPRDTDMRNNDMCDTDMRNNDIRNNDIRNNDMRNNDMRNNDVRNSTIVKSDFKRITVPTKRRDFTFDHKYFSGELNKT